MQHSCRLSELPQIVCWPEDGGPFVTLPQVLSQLPKSQLVQYQSGHVPRATGRQRLRPRAGVRLTLSDPARHRRASYPRTALGQSLPVNVTIGGTPAMTVGAVMPLPEGMSELMFAGALAGHRIPVHLSAGAAPIYADADFCIVGEVVPWRAETRRAIW